MKRLLVITTTMTESPLLTMPTEILEKVLKSLFSVPDSEICLGQNDNPTTAVSYQPPVSILRTCKQLGHVGIKVLKSSIADCRLSLFMNEPAASESSSDESDSEDETFTPHCVPFLRQYGKLFRSVHIIRKPCSGIELLFEHLVNIEIITFSFAPMYLGEGALSFNSAWPFLEDSELQKQLWQPRVLAMRETPSYVNKLRSACPWIDELVVHVALCITFEKCTDRLVRNRPLCHRQTLIQDSISRSLGRKALWCRSRG